MVNIKRFQQDRLLSNQGIRTILDRIWFRAHELAGRIAWCPKQNCHGAKGFIVGSNELTYHGEVGDNNPVSISCQLCGTSWCHRCKKSHIGQCGISSEMAAGNDKATEDSNEKYLSQNTRACPKCAHAVEKDGGCDHMRCTCGTFFCFICGMEIRETYNYHVVYSAKHGTYVCPQRLDPARDSGFQPIDREGSESDTDDDDDRLPTNIRTLIRGEVSILLRRRTRLREQLRIPEHQRERLEIRTELRGVKNRLNTLRGILLYDRLPPVYGSDNSSDSDA
jgi:hypothetical protein